MLNFFGLGDYTEEEFKSDTRLLHKFIKECNTKKIKKLFSNNKKSKLLLSPDELDQLPIISAARGNNLEVFELILSFYKQLKIDINTPDKNGYTCLHHFNSISGDLEYRIYMTLLDTDDLQFNITNRDLNTPFHYFCQKFKSQNNAQFKELFEFLIKKGVDVNVINKNGESPLHKACFNTSIAQIMVTMLLENKSNVNVCNKNGETPLHYCIRMGRADLVSILLQYGADKNILAKDNKPLYQIAIEENFTKLADMLRDNADLTNTNATELLALLQNPTLREDFRSFLRNDLICEENISFWTDVEAFRYLKVDIIRLLKEFYRITEKYIVEGSPCEVNLPHQVKKPILSFMKDLPTLEDLHLSPLLSSSTTDPNLYSHLNSSNNNQPTFSIMLSSSKSFESLNTPPSFNNSNGSNGSNGSSSSSQHQSPLTMSTASPEQLQQLSSLNNEKLQSVFNNSQSHIFNLMSSDSLAKYKKKSFLNK